MRILIIGGTRFIGPRVAERLLAGSHEVTLFHRGPTEADLASPVNHIYGDRRDLPSFTSQFESLAPDVVLDMICYNEREAFGLIQTFSGVARRVVVALVVGCCSRQMLGVDELELCRGIVLVEDDRENLVGIE